VLDKFLMKSLLELAGNHRNPMSSGESIGLV